MKVDHEKVRSLYNKGLKPKQIAEILGVSEQSVRNHIIKIQKEQADDVTCSEQEQEPEDDSCDVNVKVMDTYRKKGRWYRVIEIMGDTVRLKYITTKWEADHGKAEEITVKARNLKKKGFVKHEFPEVKITKLEEKDMPVRLTEKEASDMGIELAKQVEEPAKVNASETHGAEKPEEKQVSCDLPGEKRCQDIVRVIRPGIRPDLEKINELLNVIDLKHNPEAAWQTTDLCVAILKSMLTKGAGKNEG